ncbi:MAG TPA: hypothetical protein VJG13_07660 [Thermoanaerobaculia bacterium]|nr:hypothetical protein [Thermoanaerobaculia bacterium]
MALQEKIRELDDQVAQAVRRAVEDLREEVRRRLDEATSDLQRRLGEVVPALPDSFISEDSLRRIAEEAAAPAAEALEQARSEARGEGRDEGRAEGELRARAEAHEGLRSALAEIDRAASQAGILEALLEASGRHATRSAILLLRDGGLTGWGARGFEAGPEAVRSVALAADGEPWSAVAAGGPARTLAGARCAPLVSQLDSPLPAEGCAVPLVLRDRVAAILYADRPEAAGRLDLAALQVLTYAAALALETLAFRQRTSTATLEAAAGVAAAAPAIEAEPEWAAAPSEEEVLELPEAPEIEVEELKVEEAVEVDELEVEALPAAGPELEEVESYPAPPHGDQLLEAVPEPEPPSPAAFDDTALDEVTLEEAPALEGTQAAEPIPWQTEPAEAPAEAEPEPEAEPETEPEAEEASPPPPATPGGQVAPPEDVEGPGWAFSATRGPVPKDTEAAHEEARRLARLLVSEIQLYNQEEVDAGRRNRDLYERLKDDIDRSRQLYDERVDAGVRERTDYFYQELVRQLGAGDAKALGI